MNDTVGAYCRSKLLAEQYAFSMAREGRPVSWRNPRCRWGLATGNLAPDPIDPRLCRGRLPATMDCTLNLIDVRDVARAFGWSCSRKALAATFRHENLTLVRLLQRLSDLTGVPMPRWRVPYSVDSLSLCSASSGPIPYRGGPQSHPLTGLRPRGGLHFDSRAAFAEITGPRRSTESPATPGPGSAIRGSSRSVLRRIANSARLSNRVAR